jgi:DNA mismatch repair protein MSH3
MSSKESVLSGTFLTSLRTHKPFSDGHMRTELEVSFLSLLWFANFSPFMYHSQTRMVHCKPAELLLAEQGLTKPTERMLKHFAGCVPWIPLVHKDLRQFSHIRSITTERRIRIERHKNLMSYTDAFDFVSKFYTQKTHTGKASTSFTSGLYLTLLVCLRVLKHDREVNG